MSTHGLGSLRKINTGTWELTFYHDNKRRYTTIHASTKREAWKLAITKKESLALEKAAGYVSNLLFRTYLDK